jgi:hypothetical protein
MEPLMIKQGTKVNLLEGWAGDRSEPMAMCSKIVFYLTNTRPTAAEISRKKGIKRDMN